jgi:antitoxin (DNA-binding transcriptional repressor) of toxin-antitoxin stability system
MNKMNQEIEELQSFTIEEFQADFDNLIDRVQNGESLLIQSEHGNAIMVPYNEVIRICEESNVDFEEIVKIHTDHEEGS